MTKTAIFGAKIAKIAILAYSGTRNLELRTRHLESGDLLGFGPNRVANIPIHFLYGDLGSLLVFLLKKTPSHFWE